MVPAPFTISIDQQLLDDLRQRLIATAWPDDIGNDDGAYGIPASVLRPIVDHWIHDYDWRAAEARINRFAHHRAEVDGHPIHFIREPGRGPKPMPLILTHGWPWTFWDMHKVIGPLADPAAFGGDPADAFDVIVPSLPGFAFSTPVRSAGLNFSKTADLWRTLMVDLLGHDRFAAAGGDWGALVTAQLGHKYAADLHGIHLTHAIPLNLFNGERFWDLTSALVPNELPDEIRRPLLDHLKPLVSHVAAHTLDSQTLAYAMHDSPVGMLAWIAKRRIEWSDTRGDADIETGYEHLITTVMLYWVTRSFGNSMRFYADAVKYPWAPSHDRLPVIEAPAGLTFLGGEFPPGSTVDNHVANFQAGPTAAMFDCRYAKAHPTGGHFGHFENPDACIADIRATFRPMR